MRSSHPTTQAKALDINLNPMIYGTFAEIGAGQETARFFFQAGKASLTIAKTMSAYDMTFSDEIYGREPNGRYVCESRLVKMLDKEYSLLLKRLSVKRGSQTTFFSFANTVATGAGRKKVSNGWIGIRFQLKPGAEYNEILMHVRMLSRRRLLQQEALGVLGVNLVWAAFNLTDKETEFIPALTENLTPEQVTVDMIRFRGPDIAHLNVHLMNLELVKREFSEAVLFGPSDQILDVSDFVFDKPLVIERGNFRPLTKFHFELLACGMDTFSRQFASELQPTALFELTMHAHQNDGPINEQEFLERVRALNACGHYVLVSNVFLFFRLKSYLRRSTKRPMVMLIGAVLLSKIFDEKYYQDLDGSILEGLGKLMDANTRVYVYSNKHEGKVYSLSSFEPPTHLLHIFQHFVKNGFLVEMGEIKS